MTRPAFRHLLVGLLLTWCLAASATVEQLKLGIEACNRGDFRTAVGLLEQAHAHFLKTEGERGEMTLKAMGCLSKSYGGIGRTREAFDTADRLVQMQLQRVGEDHPDTLAAFSLLAAAHAELGQFDKRLQVAQRAHDAALRRFGERHAHTLDAANNLAVAFFSAGRPADMVALAESVLERRRQVQGETHPRTLNTMNNLLAGYAAVDRQIDRAGLADKVLTSYRQTLGDAHPDTWAAMNNAAVSYQAVGRHEEAVTLQREVLTRRRDLWGPTHPLVLESMGNLAAALRTVGRSREALPLSVQALRSQIQALGQRHPATLRGMSSLADLHGDLGNLATQKALAESALLGRRAVLGPRHPDTLASLRQMQRVQGTIGREEDRLELAQRLLTATTDVHGPLHSATFAAEWGVAAAEAALGRHADAHRRLNGLLDRQTAALGPTHGDSLVTVSGLAVSAARLKRHEEQLTWAERLVQGMQASHPPDHPTLLAARHLLGNALGDNGRHEESLDTHRQVLDLSTRHLGEQDRKVLEAQRAVFRELLALERWREAQQAGLRFLTLAERHRAQPGLTESERQAAFVSLAGTYRSLATLTGALGEVQAALLLAEAGKARTLQEGLIQRRASRADVLPAAERERLDVLERRAAAIVRQMAQTTKPELLALIEPQRSALGREHDVLVKDLQTRFPRYAALLDNKPLMWPDFKSLLAADAAVLSFVGNGAQWSMVVADSSGRLDFISLGDHADMADMVEVVRNGHQLTGGLGTMASELGRSAWRLPDGRYRVLDVGQPVPAGASAVTDLAAATALLGQRLLGRAWPLLKTRSRWIISPDGALARLPFELLGVNGQRVLDHATVHYVASLSTYAQARALQDDYRRLPRGRQLLALGDPTYGGTDAQAVRREAQRTVGRLSLADMGALWVPLPGTRREVEAIGRLFPDQADVFVGEKASKQTLQRLQAQGQLKDYRYLHVAAHGFVSELDAGLSGIALAQTGLPANSDGYVTATEWPMFDLRTELTVLSACDTGLGRQVTGEGVLGLPFALQLAGSASTLLSLWPVDDDATALLMLHLYQAMARGAAPVDALVLAKRQLANHPRWNAARFWAPFVLVGAG